MDFGGNVVVLGGDDVVGRVNFGGDVVVLEGNFGCDVVAV